MSDDVVALGTTRRCECGSCGYETDCTAYENRGKEGWHRHSRDRVPKGFVLWKCDLCAGTLAGAATQYPAQYPNVDVLQTICFVGNAILDAIKGRAEKGGER